MPSLFENAVASIRMGVEDFRQQDVHRTISAVRNLYAGVLLLIKEALLRAAPEADPNIVIGAKLRPVPDGEGGVQIEQVGHSTIDFQQIGERAKSFGVKLDDVALRTLNRIRNDLEHHYTDEPDAAIRAAISQVLPVAISLFRQLDEDPLVHLADVWGTLLETKDVYDAERREAQNTFDEVLWHSTAIDTKSLRCTECGSELVAQIDPENSSQDLVELHCRTCGASPNLSDAIEQMFEDLFGAESYLRVKDAGEDGPVYDCPVCNKVTIHEDDQVCAACGEGLDFARKCGLCGQSITIQDFLDGLDNGLCSYCQYVMNKIDD